MKVRLLALFLMSLLAVGCAPEPESEPEPEPAAEPAAEEAAPMDAEAEVDAVRAAYIEHYNAGDADALAALFTEGAVTAFADGGVNMGRDAIRANHVAVMADDPTAQIEAAETMVFPNGAVQRGSYQVRMAPPEGEAVSFGGNYMTEFVRNDMGEWKIAALISNYDTDPPAGMPAGTLPDEIPPDVTDNAIADLAATYAERYNAGDAAGVAELYTEDAVAGFAGTPLIQGHDAIQANLQARIDQGRDATIHTVEVMDLGDGWSVAGGWYEFTTEGAEPVTGNWMLLATTAEDGSPRIHWMVTNMTPAEGM